MKFMEDFLTIREETASINMYADTYHNFIGRLMYQELYKAIEQYSPKNVEHCLKILDLL